MLPKCFAIFVPLFCRLLTYEGTLMLPTLFEMLVRSPVLLVCHTQGVCWPNVCRTAYTFRVPGPVFKAGLIFILVFSRTFSFPLPTYKRCRRCSNLTILLLYCLVFSVIMPSFATQPVLIYSRVPKPNCCHLPLVLPIAFSRVDVAQIQHNAAVPLVRKLEL